MWSEVGDKNEWRRYIVEKGVVRIGNSLKKICISQQKDIILQRFSISADMIAYRKSKYLSTNKII